MSHVPAENGTALLPCWRGRSSWANGAAGWLGRGTSWRLSMPTSTPSEATFLTISTTSNRTTSRSQTTSGSTASPSSTSTFLGAIRGSPEAVGALFDQVRSQVGDFYFVADVLFWGGVDFEKVRRVRPDAVTAFHAFDGIRSTAVTAGSTQKMRALGDATASQIYDQQREGFLEGAGAPVIHPGVSPQYDDASNASPCAEKRELSPVGTQTYALTSLEDWDHVLRRLATGQRWAPTRVRVRRNCSEQVLSAPTDPAVVWLYSFNEWAEGRGVEPLQPRTPKYPHTP